MRRETAKTAERAGHPAAGQIPSAAGSGYQPPSYQVVCLACEISAYAPDGDTPLF